MANRTVTYRGFKLFEWQKGCTYWISKKGIGSGHIHCVKRSDRLVNQCCW